MSVINELFTERFRPKNLDSIILNKRISDIVGDGNISQHMLLEGPPGTGKCVTFDTIVKIRDNETGEIVDTQIGGLFINELI